MQSYYIFLKKKKKREIFVVNYFTDFATTFTEATFFKD